MHPHLTHQIATERRRDLIAEAARARAARPRRRLGRRARLAAALPAALAALVLPAVADAASANVVGTILHIQGSDRVDNSVSVSQLPDGRFLVADTREAIPRGTGCVPASGGVACSGANRIFVGLAGGNDVLSSTTSAPTQYFGGDGDDVLVSGTGPGPSKIEFTGNGGRDTANYAAATRSVTVTKDGVANDGRTDDDGDNILDDVEVLQGSRFADTLSGGSANTPDRFVGLGGDDTLIGRSGNDVFFMGGQADGADQIRGDSGFDTVDYRTRTRPLTVTVDAGGADDGEAGERDEILGMEQLITGPGADTLAGSPFSTSGSNFVSGAGVDRITGTDGPDGFTAGAGRDTVDARGGADIVRARDGEADTIACGSGTDTLQADPGLDELVTGCETVERVGVLRLAPTTVRTKAREVARIRLSWRHPRTWHRLRSVTLQVRDGDVPVGEIAVRPRGQRMTDAGAVRLVRRASRMRRAGTTVRAQLGLRLDPSLAGRRLALDVEATDVRGRRQIERGAGAIRLGQ